MILGLALCYSRCAAETATVNAALSDWVELILGVGTAVRDMRQNALDKRRDGWRQRVHGKP